jgi:hypothetical protein
MAVGPSGAESTLVPFGDIVRSPDGTLGASCYSHAAGLNTAHFVQSENDGRTWSGPRALIGAEDYNETALLCLDEARWLAACRTRRDGHLELFASQDAGATWSAQGTLTLPAQHPGHLTRLHDGRVLLVYGLRNRGLRGVGARWSQDEGRTWEDPVVLVDLQDAADVGYPSSVQVADGTIVTAYYCDRIPAHQRYHMGVVLWQAGD